MTTQRPPYLLIKDFFPWDKLDELLAISESDNLKVGDFYIDHNIPEWESKLGFPEVYDPDNIYYRHHKIGLMSEVVKDDLQERFDAIKDQFALMGTPEPVIDSHFLLNIFLVGDRLNSHFDPTHNVDNNAPRDLTFSVLIRAAGEGGFLNVNHERVPFEKGDLVIFDGMRYPHEITQVDEGKRVTLFGFINNKPDLPDAE